MKTRILVLLSLAAVFGCDNIERDESKCSNVHGCREGSSCVDHRCVPNGAAGPDASLTRDAAMAPADTAGDRPLAPETRADAPGDALEAYEVASDTPVTTIDAPADVAWDSPMGDGPRTCGDDQDCPSDLPLCLDSVCVQCKSNSDCPSGSDGGADDGGSDGGAARGGFCNLLKNLCVGCLKHSDCRDPGKPVCGVTQTCVACANQLAPDDGCTSRNPALPACNPATGRCEQCVRASDCSPRSGDGGVGDAGRDGGVMGGVCSVKNTCVECNSKTDCTADPARPFCVGNACVGCGSAGAAVCTGAKPLCATSGDKAGQCVECTGNAQCLQATAPICEANQCRGCKKDSDCSAQAGICALDGSCPKTTLVTYVQNSSKCTATDRGRGTLDFPFCDLESAITAATGNASMIRLIGTIVSPAGLAITTTRPLLIAGQSAATAIINPALGSTTPVITIAGGEVTLRDLTITGGKDAGISASAGTLHVHRCYVLNNVGTGILVGNGVAFDIANTVIAGNGGTTNSGVTLGTYNGTGPSRFVFNTVVNNGHAGVVCTAGYKLTGILANNNGMLDVSANCITDSTSSTAAPGFGSNFHLTANSPCVNAGGSTCTAQDIDGEARPKGSACDCGADEF